jgi:hypothetical protein
MIQLALAGLGECWLSIRSKAVTIPSRIEAALASEKPVEQIRAKCSIPTIALSVKVTPVARERAPVAWWRQTSRLPAKDLDTSRRRTMTAARSRGLPCHDNAAHIAE